MLQVSKCIPQGHGLAPVLLKRAATIELDWDVRQKSRFDTTDSQGRQIGVFLPRGTVVRGGDVLVAEDGSLVRVLAAPQAVLRITHCSQHGTPFDLTRAAYHLGNRHVPIELRPEHLQIEPDHLQCRQRTTISSGWYHYNTDFDAFQRARRFGGVAQKEKTKNFLKTLDTSPKLW